MASLMPHLFVKTWQIKKIAGAGFKEAYSPKEERPNAWCDKCNEIYLKEGEWNDQSEKFAQVTMICSHCYDESMERNSK